MRTEQRTNELIEHSNEEPRNKKATFLMRDSLHKRLKKQAVTEDRKMAEIVDDAVEMYLKKFEE